jgi:hypothetical protein
LLKRKNKSQINSTIGAPAFPQVSPLLGAHRINTTTEGLHQESSLPTGQTTNTEPKEGSVFPNRG